MQTTFDFVSPATLEEGQDYYHFETLLGQSGEGQITIVKFLSYDPCPAMAIIEDETGHRRCCRDELFLLVSRTDGSGG